MYVVVGCAAGMVLTGFLWNCLNFTVAVLDLLETGTCQTVNLIIVCIFFSNAFLEFSTFGVLLATWLGMFCVNRVHPFLKTALFFWFDSSCVSFWSIVWLSVFYCVKIVKASTGFTEALKSNISLIINASLVLTVLSSTFMTIPFLFLQGKEDLFNSSSTTEAMTNKTCALLPSFPQWINLNLYVYILVGFLCAIPLLFMLITSLRLVVYLCQHMLAMRRIETEVKSADSYMRVCKLTLSLVGVYLLTLGAVALYLISRLDGMDFGTEMLMMSLSFYCTATAVLLTASNKSLKQKLWALFCRRSNQNRQTGSQ